MKKSSILFWCGFCLVWGVIPLFYFPRLFFDATFISSQDPLQLEFAAKIYFYGSLKAGSFSLLYPDNLLGISFVANPVYGIFYPPSLLYLLVDPVTAFKLIFILHYVLLGSGWTLVLRRFTGDLWIGAITATIFVGSGLIWSFHQVAMVDLQSSTWIPWVIFCFMRFLDTRNSIMVFLCGVSAAMAYLGGDPLSAGFAWFLALCFSLKGGGHSFREASVFYNAKLVGAGILGSVVVFFVIVFPLLQQSLEFLPISERAVPFSRYEAMSFSFYPLRIVEMIAPVFSTSVREFYNARVSADFGTRYWFPSVALGFSVFLYFCLGVWSSGKRVISFVLLISFLGLLYLSFGKHVPFADLLWEYAPGLRNMRFPERMLKYAVVVMLPFIALGLQMLRDQLAARTKLKPFFIAVLLMTVPLIEVSSSLPEASLSNLQDIAIRPPFGQILTDRIAGLEPRLAFCPLTGVSAKGSLDLDTRLWQIPMLLAPDSSDTPVTKYIPCERFSDPMALRWLGVSHIIMADAAQPDVQQKTIDAYGLNELHALEGVDYRLYRINDSGPSLGLVTETFVLRSFLGPLRPNEKGQPEVDVTEVVSDIARGMLYIDPKFQLQTDGHLASMAKETADRVRNAADENKQKNCNVGSRTVPLKLNLAQSTISGTVSSRCTHVLSLPWRFLPGWRLTVNGKEQEFLRVNELTLGIVLPPGESQFEARFAPPGLILSSWLSLAALIAIFVICMRPKRQVSIRE